MRLLQGPSIPSPLQSQPKQIYCLRNSTFLRELFGAVLSDDRLETNASAACKRVDETCTNCLRDCSAAAADRVLCCERRCRATDACRAAGSRACAELSRPFCATGDFVRLKLTPIFPHSILTEFACHLRVAPQRAPLALHAPLFHATLGVDVPRLQFSSPKVSSLLRAQRVLQERRSFLLHVLYC